MNDPKQYECIFLDRDGVINIERPNDYVKNISEFVFIDGVLDAIKILSKKFNHIFIITNQRGVGRNIMSLSDLDEVHTYMLSEIKKYGGDISRIYYCTDIDSTSINRKPNIGMAFQAQRDYPSIDFSKSVFVGNSKSDIDFGNKLGMFTVLVGDKYKKEHKIYNSIDAYYENLYKFVQNFTS
ncbi:HAD-IIIA family hydrolase [Dysgonomonas sp. Marseille-P4677]|uniref:D-glycero-alpha-D-manno-heptose-1,7-bisphosphate 7-phosphatase n=1 Tax=Dysgonomonas sp. Marseille-P4677 TaxID=2364790 RepID=UPI0019135280|nr:HAD-IIIA family hydrolase [Dysgonomonas sp. Marseille-P4677]MBK5721485.1 HAD-IIIA family hydrolase [Dysgonomonas sp. Marseille-P4677]